MDPHSLSLSTSTLCRCATRDWAGWTSGRGRSMAVLMVLNQPCVHVRCSWHRGRNGWKFIATSCAPRGMNVAVLPPAPGMDRPCHCTDRTRSLAGTGLPDTGGVARFFMPAPREACACARVQSPSWDTSAAFRGSSACTEPAFGMHLRINQCKRKKPEEGTPGRCSPRISAVLVLALWHVVVACRVPARGRNSVWAMFTVMSIIRAKCRGHK